MSVVGLIAIATPLVPVHVRDDIVGNFPVPLGGEVSRSDHVLRRTVEKLVEELDRSWTAGSIHAVVVVRSIAILALIIAAVLLLGVPIAIDVLVVDLKVLKFRDQVLCAKHIVAIAVHQVSGGSDLFSCVVLGDLGEVLSLLVLSVAIGTHGLCLVK